MAEHDDTEIDGDLTDDERDKFSRFLDGELARRKQQAKRREAPADFGDAMDRFRDEIADMLENDFGLERRQRAAGDEPPSRSGGGGGKPPKSDKSKSGRTFGDWFFGNEQTA